MALFGCYLCKNTVTLFSKFEIHCVATVLASTHPIELYSMHKDKQISFGMPSCPYPYTLSKTITAQLSLV